MFREGPRMDNLIYLVPGFISYIVLRPFGLFNFQNDSDRQITLIILSLINSGLSATLSSYFWKNSIVAMFVSAIIITVFYFLLFIVYNKSSQMIANKLNVNLYDNMGTLEHSLSQNFKDKEQFLISFDFDNKYIASGYVRNVDDQGNQQIELYGQAEHIYSIETARRLYEENDLNSIIIDYKNKVKSYVIIF
jgi:hypothetical protein